VFDPVIVFVVSVPTKFPPKKLLDVKLFAFISALANVKLPTKLLAVIVPAVLIFPV
jgi:hypothetical protein